MAQKLSDETSIGETLDDVAKGFAGGVAGGLAGEGQAGTER